MYCLLQLILAFLVCSAWSADSDDGGVEADSCVLSVPSVVQRPICELGVWQTRCVDFVPADVMKCQLDSTPWCDSVCLCNKSLADQPDFGCSVFLETANPQALLNVRTTRGREFYARMGQPPTCCIVFKPEENGGRVCINNKLTGEDTVCCFLDNLQQPELFCEYGVYPNCMTITRFLTEYDDGSKFFVRINVNYENLHKFVVQWGTRGDSHQEDCPEESIQDLKEIDLTVEDVEDMDVD